MAKGNLLNDIVGFVTGKRKTAEKGLLHERQKEEDDELETTTGERPKREPASYPTKTPDKTSMLTEDEDDLESGPKKDKSLFPRRQRG